MIPCPPNDPRLVAARLAKQRMGSWLRGLPNAHGVSVGLRERGGRSTDEICIRVFVTRKVAEAHLAESERVPATIEGVPTDVVQRSVPVPLVNRLGRTHLLRGGISIGNTGLGSSGTLGMSVFDGRTGRDLILSNWHVLCGRDRCTPGEWISQPGPFDAPTRGNRIGQLVRYALSSRVDAAVATVHGQRFLDPEIVGLGESKRTALPALGMRVRKSGRTTGITTGRVTDVDFDTQVDFRPIGLEVLSFEDQILIEPEDPDTVIASGGDSGAVWLDDSNAVVALLFAGTSDGSSAAATPIRHVLGALDVSLTRGVRTHDLLEIVDRALD